MTGELALVVDLNPPDPHVAHAGDETGVGRRQDQALHDVRVPEIHHDALGVGHSAVTGLVDRLAEHGYVERRADPDDRRQQRIGLTPDGQATLERMRELDETFLRRLLDGLRPAELTTIGSAIDLLVRQAAGIATDPDTPERTLP